MDTSSQPDFELLSNSSSEYETRDAKDYIEKVIDLKILLSRNFYGCDAKWSLFVAAASSYRCSSQLKPFPPKYRSGSDYEIERLHHVIMNIPSFESIIQSIDNRVFEDLSSDAVDLIHWVLFGAKDYRLFLVDKNVRNNLLEKYFKESERKPNFIFEVIPPKSSQLEEKFRKHAENYETKFAFHGSKTDSFYSILHNGLHQHLCKTGLFGEGIYLATELSTSLNYSPYGGTWSASACGQLVSCVALCEYVDDRQYCFTRHETYKYDMLPKEYILVKNNDIVRVRYILYYASQQTAVYNRTNAIINWANNHKCFLAILCYGLFLAALGITKNGSISYVFHLFSKKFVEIINFFKKF